MNLAYLCRKAHLTIILKPEGLTGQIPETIVCSHLSCGCPSAIFDFQIDADVTPTHVFYNTPHLGDIVTPEEDAYLKAGGLMFRTIPENVPDSVVKEFTATKGMKKLADFLVKHVPADQRLEDIVDTAILLLGKYFGHLALMRSIHKNQNHKEN